VASLGGGDRKAFAVPPKFQKYLVLVFD